MPGVSQRSGFFFPTPRDSGTERMNLYESMIAKTSFSHSFFYTQRVETHDWYTFLLIPRFHKVCDVSAIIDSYSDRASEMIFQWRVSRTSFQRTRQQVISYREL